MITIILPVRNGGHYLPIAVESVLAQSTANWRLIVLENASTDKTPGYLANLQDSRISVIPAPRSLSIEDNWGRIRELPIVGLATILGHDDVYHSDFLEGALRDTADHPGFSLWMSHFDLIDSNGDFSRSCSPMARNESATDFLRSRWLHTRDSYGTGYVFRFEDYRTTGGIPPFPNLLYADDFLWFRLASLSGLYCSPDIRFSYRSHSTSAARLSGPDKGIQAACIFLRNLIEIAKENSQLDTFLKNFGRRFAEHRELCFWKAQAQFAPNTRPEPILPSQEWASIRRGFPFRGTALKFFILRLYWRFVCLLRVRRSI